jgi:hypothetical protein
MSMTWMDREVVLKDFTVREMLAIRERFTIDGNNSIWEVLVASLHYKDDNTKVFQNLDDLLNAPARYTMLLTKWAQDAIDANGLTAKDNEAPLP